MSGTRYGISTDAITWEKEESEVDQDETGKTTITVVGSVGVSDDPTPLDAALDLIPNTIPISDSGPVGNSSKFSGAVKSGQSARYLGDDTIQVRVTYILSLTTGQVNYTFNGVNTTSSDSDKATRSIIAQEEPILSHDIVRYFTPNSRRNLASLLAGDIRVNPRYNSEGAGTELYKFIRDKEPPAEGIEEVTFDDTVFTTTQGVEASAYDFAIAISSGVTSWLRPSIRHTLTKTRDFSATNAEYEVVGEAISSTPFLAPEISGDFQWFLNGITDSTDNGIVWTTTYEYELSGHGGVLKVFYPNGAKSLV